MFENNGRSLELSSAKECQPNYERMAAQLNIRIAANANFVSATTEFLENGAGTELHRDDRKILCACVGSVHMKQKRLEEEYERILAKID